jgi:hypothetical protein
MKHASERALLSIAPLLGRIRALPGITEKKLGVYYCKSRPFLHFHEHGEEIFADVRLEGPDFDRFPSTTLKQQAILLKAIRDALE